MRLSRPVIAASVLGLVALWSATAGAQTIFRIVGPDGKVTFSDRPPEDPKAKATTAPVVSLNSAGTAGLPFELRGIVSRFPVTLYTAANCGPCASARAFLSSRGVPYTEKTIGSNEDIEALQRMSGSQSVPFATIGSQQLKGFSETEWGQFLDAAGYPKTSALPASYRNPPPSPLVAAAPAQRPAQGEGQRPQGEGTQSSAPPPPPPSNPENPTGIQF